MKKIILLLIAVMSLVPQSYAKLNGGGGHKNVTTAGTAEALSSTSTPFWLLTVCGDSNNNGKIAVLYNGNPVATPGSEVGMILGALDCQTYQPWLVGDVGDIADVKVNSTVSGEGVTYEYLYK